MAGVGNNYFDVWTLLYNYNVDNTILSFNPVIDFGRDCGKLIKYHSKILPNILNNESLSNG